MLQMFRHSCAIQLILLSIGRKTVVMELIEYKADVNLKSSKGKTALNLATELKKYEIIPLLEKAQ
jgi:ankyrin repeat protein